MENKNEVNRVPWRINHKRCALIIIDMQNEFLKPGGALYLSNKPTKVVPNIKRIIEYCRDNDIPVIYTQTLLKDKFNISPLEVSYQPFLMDKGLRQGTPGYEIIDDIAPMPGEHIVIKHRYDAFYNTNLPLVLNNIRGLGVVDTLIITGTVTNVCCESTARSAFMRDYKVVFVSDANGAHDDTAQEATLNNIRRFFGRVLSTEELITALSEGEGHLAPYVK